tara:strand:+ start:109 stop:510 length:402 start_codon:yes stop_codon:yes gene_type:complete
MVFAIDACASDLKLNERQILKQKVEAFQFLSTYHHQLHVMIGEEEGDIQVAFDEIISAVMEIENIELIPVRNAILKIELLNSESENIKKLDYLVDYYQSGLSLQIEGILRGYGYLQTFSIENALSLYDSVINN